MATSCSQFSRPLDVVYQISIIFADEPTTVAAGGYHYRHPNIIKQVEEIIDDGVSVIALDQDNQLVGKNSWRKALISI